MVWNVTLYAAETWTLSQADRGRLEACEIIFQKLPVCLYLPDLVSMILQHIVRNSGAFQTVSGEGWKTSRLVFKARLHPQLRTSPVRNDPELRLPPVQSEYPAERRGAAAVPLPESP